MPGSITVRLSDKEINAIDRLVKKGYYTTRSDFLRSAARRHLQQQANELVKALEVIRTDLKMKGATAEMMMKEHRKVRRELYKEQYGD